MHSVHFSPWSGCRADHHQEKPLQFFCPRWCISLHFTPYPLHFTHTHPVLGPTSFLGACFLDYLLVLPFQALCLITKLNVEEKEWNSSHPHLRTRNFLVEGRTHRKFHAGEVGAIWARCHLREGFRSLGASPVAKNPGDSDLPMLTPHLSHNI